MNTLIIKISKRLHPEFNALDNRSIGILGDTLGILVLGPLSLIGVIWLVLRTDIDIIQQEWPMFALFLLLIAICEKRDFYLALSLGAEQATTQGSLSTIAVWSGALLFGPTLFWVPLVVAVGEYLYEWWRLPRLSYIFWNLVRRFLSQIGTLTIAGLASLSIYEWLDGKYPLPGLQFEDLTLGLAAILGNWAVGLLVHLPYLVYLTFLIRQSPELKIGFRNFIWLSFISLGVNLLIDPFGILGAGVYSSEGIWGFLMFATGLLLICVLLHQLSKSVERSQQRSREMELLEQLGREIINGPPDASNLPELLKIHVPPMFPSVDVAIRLYPNRLLLNRTSLRPEPIEAFWEWLSKQTEPVTIRAKEIPAWQAAPAMFSILAVPILDSETHEILGGIYLSGLRIGKMDLFVLPIQSLAAQIASALHSAKVYKETLAHQKVAQELAFAGQVQASFLPSELPQVSGWQLSATIDPARETSGDFYDLIALPDGKIGFVVADVADKGTGAAIFMALSRTLIRTYAFEHPDEPETVLWAANQRILQDTRNNLFVTVFYGVLDPADGTLIYASAGHNPAFIVNVQNSNEVQKLMKTGIPMGMFDTVKWKRQTYQLAPADVLIMYTDGVTEAQDMQGNLYSEERLLKTIHANRSLPCDGLRDTVVTDIHQFVNGAPQSDDITLMLVLREN